MEKDKKIITVSGDLWAKFKSKCALEGITLKHGFNRALEKELITNEEKWKK